MNEQKQATVEDAQPFDDEDYLAMLEEELPEYAVKLAAGGTEGIVADEAEVKDGFLHFYRLVEFEPPPPVRFLFWKIQQPEPEPERELIASYCPGTWLSFYQINDSEYGPRSLGELIQ